MALLLQMADAMFPEGQGAPRAMAKVDAAAEKSNELLVNAKEAVDELWRQRGLDPKKPELTKARLGYALDKEEAVGYVVTGAMHLPRLSPDEARAIGKRIDHRCARRRERHHRLEAQGIEEAWQGGGAADRGAAANTCDAQP